MRIEGNVLLGLDEFMLRLGHLKILCNCAASGVGSLFRLQRCAEQAIFANVAIPQSQSDYVSRYLKEKKLCPETEKLAPQRNAKTFRYPGLIVKGGTISPNPKLSSGKTLESYIWGQDLWLADPGVVSKVGGLAQGAQAGSKSGFSHIVDWALALKLIAKDGSATSEGRLVAKLGKQTNGTKWLMNPYMVGNERIIFGHVLLHNDSDILPAFLRELSTLDQPIHKSTATDAFVEAVDKQYTNIRQDLTVSFPKKDPLRKLWVELGLLARKKGTKFNATSTAWHRTSSRLETMVDLGWLTKDVQNGNEAYSYSYRFNREQIQGLLKSFEESKTVSEWLDTHLVDSFLSGKPIKSTLTLNDLRGVLPDVVAGLSRPMGSMPFSAVALGVCVESANKGFCVSLHSAKESLRELGQIRPDIVRLAKGLAIVGAGAISIDLGRLNI